MWFHVLLVIVAIDLCDQAADAQCYTSSVFCEGATNAASSFDDCCRPVVANNNLERSFSYPGGDCRSCIVLGLVQSQYTLAERSASYNLRLRLLSPSTTLLQGRPRLRLLGIPRTASVDDFRVVSSDILITSASGVNVAVTISNDGIAGEPMENFTITSQPPLVIGSFDAPFLFCDSVVNIIDSDEPTYQFDQGDYVTTEGPNAHIRVVVQQIVQSVRDIHLLLTPLTYAQYIAHSNQPGSTLAPISQYHESRPSNAHYEDDRQDFNKTVRRVFFPANSGANAERRVDFPVFDDVVDEDPEGFIIVLDVDRNLTDVAVAFTPNLRTTLGRINDDDPFFFGFEQEVHVYNERRDEGTQDIIYSPAPGNRTEKTFTFALNLNQQRGVFTFGANGDISFGSNIIRPTFEFVGTLPPTSPPARSITFRLNTDDILEGQEIGLLTIAPSTVFNGFAPRFQTVRIIINDSNSASVTLDAPLIVPEQNRSFLATISLTEPSGGTTIPLEINVNDIGITATPFSDYLRLAPPTVVFQGVNRSECCVRTVQYDVTDDNITEPDEILTLSIVQSLASNQIPVEYIVQRVNVIIVDNDTAVGTIWFEKISVSVQEGAEVAVLYVAVLDGTLDVDVTVRFSTADFSATAGADYNSTTRILTLNDSHSRIAVEVPIIQDSFTELNEQFYGNLTLVDSNGINVRVVSYQATVEIINDDRVIIGFVEDSVTVNEDGLLANLTVWIFNGSLMQEVGIFFQFSTNDASAHSGSDYSSTSGTNITFTAGATIQTIRIPIISDRRLENNETFTVHLSNAPTCVTLNPDQATVTIIDDDRAMIGFENISVSIREGTGVVVLYIAVLNGTLGRDVTVHFSTADLSATAVSDYSSKSGIITFIPGATIQTIRIPIINDRRLENNETFRVHLSNAPTCVTLKPDQTTVTIIDNDVPENQLSDVILSVHNNNVTLNEKDTLLLSCSSYGYPEPIVYWRRNNQAVVNSVRVKLSFVNYLLDDKQNYVNSTLQILKLLPSDEGNYACIASNVKGTRMSSTSITVKHIDNCAGSPCGSNGQCNDGIDTFMCKCSHGYHGVPCTKIPTPPEPKGVWIVSHPMNIEAKLDQLVNLTCEVSGDPPITYQWTRDGVVLPGEVLPYILIQEVKPKHRGAYVCVAMNRVNTTTSQPGLLSINGIFQYEIQAFLNGSLDLLRGALLGPLVYYNETANKDYFYNATVLSVAVNYSGSTDEGISNRRVSVLVTVLNNDDRINSDNFGQRLKTSLMKHLSGENFQLLNVTVYDACPSQNIPLVSGSSIMIKWNETMILQQVKQPCPCQTLTQVFITRRCEGSYSQGAQWMDMYTTQCNLTERSLQLCEALSLSNKPAETVAEILVNVTAAPATLVPSEVTVAAFVLEGLTLAAAENKSVRVNYLNSINNIIKVDQEVIKQANASTSILQSLETFSETVDVNFTDGNRPTFTRENFAIQLQQIDISTFAGESFNVDLGTVEEAMNNSGNIDPQALMSLLNPLSNATGSLTVSSRVSGRIDNNASNSVRLGYSVFISSSLFPTESVNTTVASVVLNLKLSGYTESNDIIDDLFNVTFQTIDPPMNQDFADETCANWDIRGGFGRWTSDACVVVYKHGERPVKCKCNQPAHFGLLFDLVPSTPLIPEALAAITYIFLPLSMISLLIVIITYLADKQLRTQPHDQIIINLSISLFGLYAFVLISGHVTSVPALCGVSAGLLHYFMLVFFSWTAVESVFLFMKLVRVVGGEINRYTLKAGLLAWIVPAVVVVIVGGAGHMNYTNPFYCRADNIPFYVGTIVPIVLIFIFNWILYITIMVSVCHRLRSAAQVTNTNLSLRKLARTAMVLSVVLGLGWAFGLVQTSAPGDSSVAARVVLTVFQVLFSLLVGLQGILMFGFYGIGNKKVREVWLRCFFRGKSKKVLMDLFSSSQSGSSTLKTDVLGKKTFTPAVKECSEVPEKSVADIQHDQLTTAVTHDEKIPMTDCAAYPERPSVSKETNAEADYENPDVIMEKVEKKECCANDYETPAVSITEAQRKDQDTAV